MNDIKVFENSEFGKLEVLWENGKEYFPAKRCAEILGYSNPHEAVRRHCKGCVKRSLWTIVNNLDTKRRKEKRLK